MKRYTYLLSFALATLLISSCYDSVDYSQEIDTQLEDAPILITTAITGSVVDSDDSELSNYTITVGDVTESIQSKRFLLQVEDINKNGQAIYIKSDNQINSILHTPLIENDINLVKLQMFDPMNSSLISSSGPDLIEISPSITLEIKADKIRDNLGNIPTQDIYIDHRDLSNLNNIAQLGVSAYNYRDQLRSTRHIGAFQIEARGEDGTAYSISEKSNLTINLSNTNAGISLFHFDMNTERWIEVAALQSGTNPIEIEQTGLYTISEHTKAVYAEGEVNKEGVTVSYQSLLLEQQKLYATAEGRWITIIPAEKDVILKTLTPCSTEISSYDIPGSDINIKDIDIEVTTGNYYKLQTTVYDCDGELEETTAIYLRDESNIGNIYTFADKNLNTWVSVCDAEFDISTYDIDTDHKGPAIPWSLDIVDDQSFLVSCDEYVDGYSYIKIRNEKRVLPPFEAMKLDDETTLHSPDNKIRFKFEGQMADNYSDDQVNVFLEDETFGPNGYAINCETTDEGCGFTTWNVTHYEAGNDKWVRVSFAGEVWMQTISPPEAGYFPVEGVILTKAQ